MAAQDSNRCDLHQKFIRETQEYIERNLSDPEIRMACFLRHSNRIDPWIESDQPIDIWVSMSTDKRGLFNVAGLQGLADWLGQANAMASVMFDVSDVQCVSAAFFGLLNNVCQTFNGGGKCVFLHGFNGQSEYTLRISPLA